MLLYANQNNNAMTALEKRAEIISKSTERMKLLEWLAKELLNEWGLTDKGWSFGWNSRKKSFGLCSKRKKMIFLSKYLLPTITDESAEDTIRHEIAHALDFEDRGTSDHGPKWKAWARKVGADPTRCGSSDHDEIAEELAQTSKYTLVCPNGHKFPSHRKRKRLSSCGKCCPGHYNEDYLLTQVQNY